MLLAVAILGGLFLASTAIAQLLTDRNHSGSANTVAQSTADPNLADALDQHQASVAPADISDVDAVPTDADLVDLDVIDPVTRPAKHAMSVTFRNGPSLKGFSPPP